MLLINGTFTSSIQEGPRGYRRSTSGLVREFHTSFKNINHDVVVVENISVTVNAATQIDALFSIHDFPTLVSSNPLCQSIKFSVVRAIR